MKIKYLVIITTIFFLSCNEEKEISSINPEIGLNAL